jgi:DNA repair exonuclease SbcCD ATPase subunit
MSKPEKPAKTSATLQLKKDLNQAGKTLQSLAEELEKRANSLSEAEAALAQDRYLKEEILSLRGQIGALREEKEKAVNAHREDIASWADANLVLTQEYRERSLKMESMYQSKLEDSQKCQKDKETKLKQALDCEKAEVQRLKQAENHVRQGMEAQLRKAKEEWQRKEDQLQARIQQRESQIVQLSKEIRTWLRSWLITKPF